MLIRIADLKQLYFIEFLIVLQRFIFIYVPFLKQIKTNSQLIIRDGAVNSLTIHALS